ncbi:MAG: pimeloyl-ACP methyl ester carboxylesterase [Acidimicrobiales bacterium]|jgi:pimeloyl-ACP methyl ester carboxylesterase
MATFQHGDVELYYEDHGEGFPVFLIAPGGMRSAVSFWHDTPWNPIEQLSDRYRVIAMDQRNATGRSPGPVAADHGWETFANDQLALLNHLGVDQFHVQGMCIGGPYIMGLIKAAPERVASATMFQTIGRDNNQQEFYDMFDSWATDLKPGMPDLSDADWTSFRSNMYDGDEFLFTADEAFVSSCTTPMVVLMGRDIYHPEVSSRDLARLAPNATLIEEWMHGDARTAAMSQVSDFLAANTPD